MDERGYGIELEESGEWKREDTAAVEVNLLSQERKRWTDATGAAGTAKTANIKKEEIDSLWKSF